MILNIGKILLYFEKWGSGRLFEEGGVRNEISLRAEKTVRDCREICDHNGDRSANY